MKSTWRQFVIGFGMLLSLAAPALSQESLTADQEAAAIKFARTHHKELAELLNKLDEDMTSEYEKAIRQIHLVRERLERIKKRSPEDYKLQLSVWKVDSRVKLLAARMTISSDEKLVSEMERLLQQKIKLKEQLLVLERERAQARIQRIDGQLETIRKNRQEYLEKELARYKRLQRSKTSPTATRNSNNQ
ncbi:MAG: hypothetical protein HUJ26_08400 [Planctomycetaceae bacterium]|nr:hypothetical protein [Planctomycetaceae bacterium]